MKSVTYPHGTYGYHATSLTDGNISLDMERMNSPVKPKVGYYWKFKQSESEYLSLLASQRDMSLVYPTQCNVTIISPRLQRRKEESAFII